MGYTSLYDETKGGTRLATWTATPSVTVYQYQDRYIVHTPKGTFIIGRGTYDASGATRLSLVTQPQTPPGGVGSDVYNYPYCGPGYICQHADPAGHLITNDFVYASNQFPPGVRGSRGHGGLGIFAVDVLRSIYAIYELDGRRIYGLSTGGVTTAGVYDVTGESVTATSSSTLIQMSTRFKDSYGQLFDVWYSHVFDSTKYYGTISVILNPVGAQIYVKEPRVVFSMGTPDWQVRGDLGGAGINVFDGNLGLVTNPATGTTNYPLSGLTNPQAGTLGIGADSNTVGDRVTRGGFRFNIGGVWVKFLVGYSSTSFNYDSIATYNATQKAWANWRYLSNNRNRPGDDGFISLGGGDTSCKDTNGATHTDVPYSSPAPVCGTTSLTQTQSTNVVSGGSLTGAAGSTKPCAKNNWELSGWTGQAMVAFAIESWAASIQCGCKAQQFRSIVSGEQFALNLSLYA